MILERAEDIWVLAEHTDGAVQPVTYEVLAFADKLRAALGGKLSFLVIGHPARTIAEEIAAVTGFNVVGVDAEAASSYSCEVYRSLIRSVGLPDPPRFLFIPHTTTGWDLAPGLAVDLGASALSAVCGFEGGPGLVFQRRILNGKLLQDVRPIPGRPAVVTVVPGTENPYASKTSRPGNVCILEKEVPRRKTEVLQCVEPPQRSVKLREAEVIIAAGRGVGSPGNLARIHELAGLFKRGTVGASRPLCDLGLLPLTCQVGMTGQTVAPKLYIACGISGAVQHTMGMKHAGLIVAVNTDKHALFCREAHYCVLADLNAFLPILIEKIRRFRGKPQD